MINNRHDGARLASQAVGPKAASAEKKDDVFALGFFGEETNGRAAAWMIGHSLDSQ